MCICLISPLSRITLSRSDMHIICRLRVHTADQKAVQDQLSYNSSASVRIRTAIVGQPDLCFFVCVGQRMTRVYLFKGLGNFCVPILARR